jgi:hypothetical protein
LHVILRHPTRIAERSQRNPGHTNALFSPAIVG